MKATYGYSVLPKNDPLYDLLDRAARAPGEVESIGATSVDLLPFCEYTGSLESHGSSFKSSSAPCSVLVSFVVPRRVHKSALCKSKGTC